MNLDNKTAQQQNKNGPFQVGVGQWNGSLGRCFSAGNDEESEVGIILDV